MCAYDLKRAFHENFVNFRFTFEILPLSLQNHNSNNNTVMLTQWSEMMWSEAKWSEMTILGEMCIYYHWFIVM